MSVSSDNIYVAGGLSDKSISVGAGFTTAHSFSLSVSVGETAFSKHATKLARTIGKKIRKKVKKKAGC